jgi:hypothetical protein
MRRALFATAGMNILVALAFLPGADRARAVAGFPEGGHPLFLGMIALFVLLFGLGYLWAALTGHADHLFIALATVGKLTFFVMLVGFWAAGAVPFRAPALGTADLVFGILFLTWLLNARTGTRHAARRVMSADTPASRSRA